MLRRHFLAASVTAAAAAASSLSIAQDKPTIKLLVGFGAGGSTDLLARLVAERLRATLNQNVVVENKPGAGGRVALGELKRAAPDGLTLALTPSGPMSVHPWFFKNLPYDPVKDFTPIGRAASFDFALTVGPAAPAGDIKTVMAWMKANPNKANFATSGAGTLGHFTGQMLSQAMAIPMTHVPYKSGSLGASDLMGGQVPLMIDTATETLEQHRHGKLRIIAVSGDSRARVLPDVPTLKESGVNVVADGFMAVYGPAGMSADLVTRISQAMAEGLQAKEAQDKIYTLGLIPGSTTSPELARLQAAHLRRWEDPVKSSGFTAE